MKTLSLRVKLLLLVTLFAVAPLLALTFLSVRSHEDALRAANLDALEAIATAKAQAIDQFTEDRLRDVERIASLVSSRVVRLLEARRDADDGGAAAPPPLPLPDVATEGTAGTGAGTEPQRGAPPAIVDTGEEPAPPPPPPRPRDDRERALADANEALERALSLVLWDRGEFEELMVIDPRGIVVASTFQDHEGMTAEALEYFQNGRRTTYMQPLFLSPITKQLSMVIATPVRNGNGQDVAVLAARLNLSQFFRVIGDATGLGATGEAVVAKRIEDRITFMAPTRHDPAAAFTRTVPLGSELSTALQEASRGQRGAGSTTDYRGIETLGAWMYVPSLDWGLLVKIDTAEAMRSATAARRQTFVLAAALLAAALIVSILATRALVRPLRELKDATDKLSRGDFAVRLDIASRDEIGELADSFERMVAAIKFFRERAERPDAEDADAALGEDGGSGPR